MNKFAKLTKKQQSVFDLILDGHKYQDIATIMGTELVTIKKHAQSILVKHKEPTMHSLVCNWYKDQLHYERIKR